MFKRSALPALLVSAAALLSTAAPAAATPITIGPTNIAALPYIFGTGQTVASNRTSDGVTSYAAPAAGNVSSYTYKTYNCPGDCVSRLLVLRYSTGRTYDIVDASSANTGSTSVQTWPVDLDVQQGDFLAVDVSAGGIQGTGAPGATNDARGGGASGTSVTFNDAYNDNLFQYNVEFTAAPTPVTTSVSVDRPSTANAGDAVAYVAHVDRNTGTDRSVIGGTVSFDQDGIPIAACQSLPVTAGDATCTTTVSPVAGRHSIQVSYSGDSPFEPTTGSGSLNVRQATTTTAGTQDPGPFDPSSAITFTATVTPPPSASFAVSTGILQQLLDRGKAAFSVDGVPVEECGARLVDAVTGLATCSTTAPAEGADHVVTVNYSGGTFYLTSVGEAPFKLKLPEAPVPPTAPTPPPVAPPVPPSITAPAPTGAIFAPNQSTTLPASAGRVPSVTVPVRCPDGNECAVEGTVTVATSTQPALVRAAKVSTATVARFSRVRIAGGAVKKLKLHLDAAFVRKAQKQGIRRVRATLTILTTLGSGAKVTTHQKITIVLPKAKRKAAAPHFTG